MKFRKAEEPDWRPSAQDWDDFLKVPRIQKYEAELAGDSIPEEALVSYGRCLPPVV